MRLLLDTHTFLWWIADDPRLTARASAAIAKHDCLVSLTSFWEIAIKVALGKLSVSAPLERFIPEQLAANGFGVLPIEIAHVARVARLPLHHRDPFDRLLAAQALIEELTIVSADAVFREYGIKRLW